MFVKALWFLPLVLFCWVFIDGSKTPEDSCFCGYGGVCRFINGKALEWNCSDCETISGGLYENCRNLVNHCKSNPCMNNGVCVMTFGSFYCECPSDFLGHTCKYRRTEQEMDLEPVVAPRAWFQVNRVGPKITQLVRFTFDRPGDNIRFHVRYDDGRFFEVPATKLKLINAKQECIRDVNENPQERDIRVCETLLDKNVYGITLNPRYFDGYDDDILPMKKVILSMYGKNITEGRVNEIHIAVINMNRVTFSQVYRIHTSFELKPKCKYRISFIGCTRRKSINILHDKGKPIYLKAIQEPLEDCSACIVVESSWKLPGKSPFISHARNNSLVLRGDNVNPGRNYIDFMLIVRGKPPHFGAPDLSYNYARCWFKVVLGKFRVGLVGGKTRVAPCITPLTLRLFSINPNFKENEFASVWRCEPASLHNCELKRFLGSKIFFRTLPCETKIYFKSMIVHLPTGNKYYLSAQVRTSIHIDTLHCRCLYNCQIKVDPRSKTKLWAEDVRLSTNHGDVHIEWSATLSGQDFDITKSISSETMGRGIEIDTGTLVGFEWFEDSNPILQVRAQWNDLFCQMELEIDIPPSYIIPELKPKTRLRDVEDFRYGMIVHNIGFSKLIEPMTFEAREIISENQYETIEYIRAEFREFSYLKMDRPTYIIARNLNGLESTIYVTHEPKVNSSRIYLKPLRKRIDVIEKLLEEGNFNVVVTEIMYCTRDIMVQKRHFFREKLELLVALKKVIEFTLTSSTTSALCELTKILQIINRVTVTEELTKPPFNIDISPWIVPRRFIYPIERVIWSKVRRLASSIIRKVSKHYYLVSSEEGTTRYSHVTELLFDALLRQSMSMLRQKGSDYQKVLDFYPAGRLQYDRDRIKMRQNFDESVHYLQRAVDHHKEGYPDDGDIERGTVTLYSVVLPAHSISQLTRNWYNSHQQVYVRIEITDDTIASYTLIFFSIYVEIPSKEEMTTRVHICLVTHLMQNQVKATIETQMHIHKPGGKDSPTDMTIAYVQDSKSARDRQKYITTYKIEIPSEPYTHVDRQISLHFESEVEVVLQVDPELPHYDQLYLSPARGKGSFNVSTVANQNVLYLGLIPGQDVPPGSPRRVSFNLENAVCAVRRPTEAVGLDFSNDKITECHIAQSKKFTTVAQITCVCPGDGIVTTYRSEAVLYQVLSELEHDELERIEKELKRGSLWIIPVILLIVFLIAWWRDKTNEKKEYIQSLEDTFPGDSHPYIVGVYTGKRLFASTRAKVAIQVFGPIANSRVHILRSNSFKTLGRAQDDWFIVYTKEHLGKLAHITLWQDFDKIWPDWYCSHIVIYDVEQTTWYRFPVHRRVGTLSGGIENARSITVHGVKFHPEIESMMSFSLLKHYLRVLRNVHPLLSIFFKHRRHIHSHRHRAMSFILLTLPLISAVLYLDDVIGRGILNRWLNDFYNSFSTLTMIFLIFSDIPGKHLRIIVVANCSLICIGGVFFVIALIIGMSFVKTRKTRKLDLQRVSDLKAAVREHNSLEKKSIAVFMEEELERNSSEQFLRQRTELQSSRTHKRTHLSVDPENYTVVQHFDNQKKPSAESDDEKHVFSHDIDYEKPSQDSGHKKTRKSILHRNLADESSGQRDLESVKKQKKSQSPDSKVDFSIKSVDKKSSKYYGSGKHRTPVDSTWSHQSKWVSLFKWIPDASFRPIRFDNKLSYIRFGGRGLYIAGWTLSTVLIFSSLAYFAYRTVVGERYHGMHVLSIVATAAAFQWLLYSPIFYFFTSLLTVFYAKLGNFECHILELGSLPANTKKIDHLKFMNEVTQPWYHPQKTEKLEHLHQQYWDRKSLMLYAFCLLVLTCFLTPGVLTMWINDSYSIWRLKNSTGNALRESVSNDYYPEPTPQALETARRRKGIRKYLLSVYLPATRNTKWYNEKPLKIGKGFSWFIDRASKLYGSTIIRTISASNKTRAFVRSYFRPYYEDAFSHFDMNSNHITFMSDWSKIYDVQSSWPHLDRLLDHGIRGKSGLFYPQCIGKEIFLREDKSHSAAGIFEIVQNNVNTMTRALIMDLNVIHPSFSSNPLNPAYAVTRVQILFENAAAGPYSGSVHTSLEYANGTTNNLRYISLTVYSSITIFFVIYVIIRMCYEGITACFKEFRGVTVTIIAVLSFINFLLLLEDILIESITEKKDVGKTIATYTHVDFIHHFIQFVHSTVIELLIASLLLLLCVLLADLVNEAIGFLKKGYEKRFLLLPLLAYLLVLYFSLNVELALRTKGASFGRISLIQVDKTAIKCKNCIHFMYFYAYIWIATVGITISCQSMGFERFPSDQVIRHFPFRYVYRCFRKSKKAQEVNEPEEEITKNTGTTNPNVADRLSQKFVLWE